MSFRFTNEWITDLDDKVLGDHASCCQETLNKLSLPCRYPEFDMGYAFSDSTDVGEVRDALNVTTVMPPKIRTLSTMVLNDDNHRIHPLRVLYSSQPFFQGLTDIWACVVSFIGIALLTNTTFYLS